MNALALRLKQLPPRPIDAAPLAVSLPGRSAHEVAALRLAELLGSGGRSTIDYAVGDLFDVRAKSHGPLEIEGDLRRFHRLAHRWSDGDLVVRGDVGDRFAAEMSGGSVRLGGSAGDGVAEQMSGGVLKVAGNVGDDLGRPLVGRRSGISGGQVVVQGRTGDYAGYRMRRGTILIHGDCGGQLGCDLVAGTILVAGRCGPGAGRGMRRGTLILGGPVELSDLRFTSPRQVSLGIARLLANQLRSELPAVTRWLEVPLRRRLGDLSCGGKGEIWLPAAV